MDPLESDWKIFSKHLPIWRERYLEKETRHLIDLLSNKDKTSTELFWAAKKEMDEEAEILNRCLDGYSRSKMELHLVLLYNYGFIFNDDLNEFSEDLRKRILAKIQI